VFLYGAAFFALRGVQAVKDKRRIVKQMKEEESRKVEELTRLTAELEARTAELADANREIAHASRAKSQFLANMSHELRTPLNSIMGFADIVLRRSATRLEEKEVKFITNIRTSGEHLLGLINDLLDLSKIEAGKLELHPEPFDVGERVEGVCALVHGVAAQRKISFDLDIPRGLPEVTGDPVRFKQVLYNLLSNAIKFSPEGATVRVEATEVAGEPASIRLAVIDQGIGIAPEDQETIFEEFSQVDGSPGREQQGTGLGLALVRRFVELHGGSITVESAVGLGSTFTVTLPVRFVGARVEEPALDLPTSRERQVLVVEDDPTAYELLQRELRAAGYLPVRARTGEQAVELAHRLQPVAITLDIILPGLSGWEVLKALKAGEGTRDIPIVIVSMAGEQELGFALGADDYFLKPVDAPRLLRRLAELAPIRGPSPQELLIIDDDPTLHELLEAQLPEQYTFLTALSGREGIDLARQHRPSLVVLDLMMEGMDGFEVATRLKADPETRDLPIIVLTARDLSAEDRSRLRGRIEGLVQKADLEPSRLVSVIENLVARTTTRSE
jgi:signal transduction histidine kinase/CheY-like chemotaxis protein